MLLQETELTSRSQCVVPSSSAHASLTPTLHSAAEVRRLTEAAQVAAGEREMSERAAEDRVRGLERDLQEAREQAQQFMHQQQSRFEEQQQFGAMMPPFYGREQPPLQQPFGFMPVLPGAYGHVPPAWGAQIQMPANGAPMQQSFLPPPPEQQQQVTFGSFAPPPPHAGWAIPPSTPPGFQRAPGGMEASEAEAKPRPPRSDPAREPRIQYVTPMPPPMLPNTVLF